MDKRFPRPLLPIPRRVNYHVWSIRTITLVALAVVTVTAASVFLLGKGSLFRETELTLAIVAAALFVFLAVGLYRGVRVRRWDLPGAGVNNVSLGDIVEGLPDGSSGGFDLGDVASGVDVEGCAGAIVGLILAIVVGVFLVLFLWIVINLGIMLWVFLIAALSWVFYLALRQVFAKSKVCRGNWARSTGYALLYTTLYTGWLFALVWVADGLLGPRLRDGPRTPSDVSNVLTPVER
jgi:hypothetical protein